MDLPTQKILLVDDSPEDRETWRRYLASDPTTHYIVTERGTIEAGLAACRSEQPDCILLDHNLPDGTGVEFLGELRGIGGTLAFPTVMLTGTGSESVAVEAMKAGAQDYLIKNRLNPDSLHRTLKAAIYKAQAERLLAEQRAELEAAYAQAKEANARKDQFLATLSHELRTPLTPILAVVSAPDVGRASRQELEETFQMIRRNVELEARLIDDLLDITRITHGKLELNLQPVNVHELIQQAIGICQPMASGKGVALVSELGATLVETVADAARLQQVFWNLINNAVKFTPPGGTVRIGSHDSGETQLAVEVTDSGMGIPPEKLERIFAAFEQGDARVTRQFGGLGLGLAICKALTEAHGGIIGASSPGLNQGAAFEVVLTAKKEDLTRKKEPPPIKPNPASQTPISWAILLVEDHLDSALALSALMRHRGYRVFHASSLAEAEALFRSESVDLIITDLGLPDGSGLDLIRSVQGTRKVPSIVLSGHGEPEAISRSVEVGVQEHLTKPVEWQQLDQAIQRILPKQSSLSAG